MSDYYGPAGPGMGAGMGAGMAHGNPGGLLPVNEMDGLCVDLAGCTTPSAHDGRRDNDGVSSDQSSRLQRNKAEKNRRDRLTGHIKELLLYLPILRDYGKKHGAKKNPDKTTILRVGANMIRISKYSEQVFLSRGDAPVPAALGDDLEALICETMNALFLIISRAGKIAYVSPCEQKLGYSQVEIYGEDIKKFIHPDDFDILKNALEPNGEPRRALLPLGLDDSSSDDTGTSTSMSSRESLPSPPPPAPAPETDAPRLKSEQQNRSLRVRIQTKTTQKNEAPHYVTMDCKGFLEVPARFTEAGAAQRTHSHRRKSGEVSSDEDVFLVLFARFETPGQALMQLYQHPRLEDRYVTRHSLDGCIIYTDDRISHISGYTPSEVLGKNAFDYMDPIDRKTASLALEQMLRRNELNGGSVYRLHTANMKFINLKTYGRLDEGGQSFLCTNILIPDDEYQSESEALKKRLQLAEFALPSQSSQPKITELAEDADTSTQEIVKSSITEARKARASVLHMAGSNIRRGQKRITESDNPGLRTKRVCPSTEVSGTLTPCVSESYLPGPVPPGGHGLPLLPGSSIVPDAIPPTPVGHLGMQDQVLDEVLPNGIWGRSEALNQTAPAQTTFSTTHSTSDVFRAQDQEPIISDLSMDSPGPVTSHLLQQQLELGTLIEEQEQDISQQQQLLRLVPESYHGRREIEKNLMKVTEEHQQQQRGFQELHRSTIQHANNFGSVNT